MKKKHTRLKNAVLITVSILILGGGLIIIFISPITKYLIEKYDEKYLGRQITLDWVYVNPFTGYIHISNLKIYEEKSDSIFISANSVSANFAMRKLFSRTIEIEEITLEHPRGMIMNTDKILNFQDIIDRFSSKKETKKSKPIHFNIYKIKLIDAEFYYKENTAPINYFVKETNIESEGKTWDADTMSAHVSLLSGIGTGDLNGNITVNFHTLDYHSNAVVHKFDLKIIEQYLQPLINYGTFKANVDGNVKATGNFNSKEDIVIKGLIAINDFHLGKDSFDDYASFEKFTLFIDEVSPKKHIYLIDSASAKHPYFKYERYDKNLDNIQTMFGKKGANVIAVNANPEQFNLIIEIAKYVKILAKNFFKSDYKINRLAIYNGDFKYNDYTLNEKFSIDASPVYAVADSINKNKQWVKAYFKTGIKPYGDATVTVRINPKDSSDFDVNYHILKIPGTMFNPYLTYYTSYPLNRGTMELNGSWNVRSNVINSDNHLLIIDPRVNSRTKNDNNSWIPLRLVMAFVRERGNVIDYEIPITGNLKDPKFHLKSVIFHTLENVFLKPVTIPYQTKVKETEKEIEKFLSFKWIMKQDDLYPQQIKFINKMEDFLNDNPNDYIEVHPDTYSEKEKETILLFEAKKKYFMLINKINKQSFTEDDSVKVGQMSIKDSLLVRYLNMHVKDSLLFTIQDKCNALVGSGFVNARLNQLMKEREKAFRSYFIENGTDKRVKFYADENIVPYNGFSIFKIYCKGNIPNSLLNAYRQMNELNDEPPRDRFKAKRERNKNVVK